MKPLITLLLFLLISQAFAQKNESVRTTLEKIVEHAEMASLYREKVDWDTLRLQIFERAEEADSISDLAPALKYMLKSIGDDHGRIFHQNKILANYRGASPPHHVSIENEVFNDIQWTQVYPFHTEMLEGKIGYIRIVGLPMGDNQQMAKDIQQEVCKLVEEGAENWVIDLRYNGGGNMHPMAEGIAAIIGEGQVGGAQGLTEAENATWQVTDGDFYYDDYSVGLENACTVQDTPKIAVLTSVYTASSGEALAVIFKGKEHKRFFGQKTHGLITVTDWHVIDDLTAMTLSVSYYRDRNGVVYNQYVDVDEEYPFSKQPLSESDACLEAARKWLMGE
ncbi:MAG: S41 family peptidase [Bacteroidota bacterium]